MAAATCAGFFPRRRDQGPSFIIVRPWQHHVNPNTHGYIAGFGSCSIFLRIYRYIDGSELKVCFFFFLLAFDSFLLISEAYGGLYILWRQSLLWFSSDF